MHNSHPRANTTNFSFGFVNPNAMLCHVALKRPENFRKRPLLQSSCERNRKQTAFTTLETDRSLPFSLCFSLTILSRTASYRNFVYYALEYGTTLARTLFHARTTSVQKLPDESVELGISEYMMQYNIRWYALLQLTDVIVVGRKKKIIYACRN